MYYDLTEEQRMFRRMVRDFATKEVAPVAAQLDETEEFPKENYKRMAELGLTGLTIPEEYGEAGAILLTSSSPRKKFLVLVPRPHLCLVLLCP